jgi:exonuclease III
MFLVGSEPVCGLMSKLKDPDFLNIFQNYDILFFQETKTDKLDHLSLPDGYNLSFTM